jgi:hypothetical protein
MNRVFFIISAFALGCLISVSVMAEDKQTGVLLEEPVNARVETFGIFSAVFNNYKYVLDADGGDDWRLVDGSQPFSGDCEDFAFAMQHMVGAGSVYGVLRHNTMDLDHAVYVYAGIVWDLDGTALTLKQYEKERGLIMYRLGDFTPDLK